MKKCFAIAIGFVIVGVLVADEPPQCNLPGYTVVAAEVCKCGVSCQCADAETVSVLTKKVAPKEVKATRTVVSHLYSATHTHECPNSNCQFRKAYGEPYVWNHGVNASHNCPYCKTEQNYVSHKPVTALVTMIQTAQPPAPVSRQVPQLIYFKKSAGGCANGNCPIAR